MSFLGHPALILACFLGRSPHGRIGSGREAQNALTILDLARKKAWNIVHVNDEGQDGYEGDPAFRPYRGEVSIRKKGYSCYAAASFRSLVGMEDYGEPYFMCADANTALATSVDSMQRDHELTFVLDACPLLFEAQRNGRSHMDTTLALVLSNFAFVTDTKVLLLGEFSLAGANRTLPLSI